MAASGIVGAAIAAADNGDLAMQPAVDISGSDLLHTPLVELGGLQEVEVADAEVTGSHFRHRRRQETEVEQDEDIIETPTE